MDTHTHPFNGFFVWYYPGEPVPEMVKPFRILLKHETMGGNGVILCKLPLAPEITMPVPPPLFRYGPLDLIAKLSGRGKKFYQFF